MKSSRVKLSDFGLTEVEQMAIEQTGVSSDNDLVRMMEEYKFVTRDYIIAVYNALYKDDAYIASIIPEEGHDEKFSYIEKKYDVVIRLLESNNKHVCIYSPMFRDIAIAAIEIELGDCETTFFKATVYDYECKKHPGERFEYNSELLFKRILIEAIKYHATDIHFDVKHVNMEPRYTVSYRQDAELIEMELFTLTEKDNQNIVSKLIENNTRAISLDLLTSAGVVSNASNVLGDGKVELRVSANKILDGYHCVIRIQQKETFNFTINRLGFAQRVVNDLQAIVSKRSGITLITGAIRTGKNTTAFALANEIVKAPVKIASYESPIEVLMPFSQMDYFGNENALLNMVRLAKKQDINVAFLNEIPNKEVAFAVMDLVNSSIHVITTMHMDRLWHLPYKLREYYGDEYKNIISQINGVFNQKMFGICCDKCRKEILIEGAKNKNKIEFLRSRNYTKIFKSEGCSNCNFTGKVAGENQPYVEHLLFSEELKSQLLACSQPYEMELIIKKAVREKKQTLEDYMDGNLRNGILSLDALDTII